MKQRFFISANGKLREKDKITINTLHGAAYVWAEDVGLGAEFISLQNRPLTKIGKII